MQVFSIFRTDVRIIDIVKRAALSHVLLESVLSSPPGENLDEKLASLQFPTNFVDRAFMYSSHSCVTDASSVPPPSSEESAWWDGPSEYSSEILAARYGICRVDHPNGVFPIIAYQSLESRGSGNPFDSHDDSPLSSSPSSSDEELYTDAAALPDPITPMQSIRKPAPPPPSAYHKPTSS
jgi:hypothetical protein